MSSDSESFVAASTDGALSLFKNALPFKTVQLPGERPLVRFINGEIVTAASYGKLTVLNKKLEVLKLFRGTEGRVFTLTGNSKYIAFGDYNGVVRYYDRGASIFPRVSCYSRH